MKRSQTAFISILSILILLTGCDKKEQEKSPFVHPGTINEGNITEDFNRSIRTKTYLLSNTHGKKIELTINHDGHILADNNISQPIIIFNFFSPWSYPSKNQLPYLVDLQKKYPQYLRVIGIVLNPHKHADDQVEALLRETGGDLLFIATGKENNALTHQILKPLSLPDFMPIPLTVIYHNGIYFRHYEGAVPVEMLDHDIQTILK